jgi:acetyl esterase
MSPEEARAASAGMDALYGTGPDMHSTENHVLDGWDGGTFEIRVHRPSEEAHAVIVYLHGGGWVVSNIDSFDTLGRQLAEKSGATVVLANYRKAPEDPFPAAVEDSWTALNWAADRLGELAVEGAPLYVAGDSAGGNLSAVMAQRAARKGGPAIARQILIYPVTDADFDRASYTAPENQTLLTKEFMAWFWDHYLPNAAERTNPEASPLQAKDLSGVAPALVVTAAHDVLRDEGEAYAHRLEEAGVDVEYHDWPGQMHGFFSMVNVLPASAEVLELVATSIREASTQKAGA